MKRLLSIFLAQFFALPILATQFSGTTAEIVYKLMPQEGIQYNGPIFMKIKIAENRDLQCAERPSLAITYKCNTPHNGDNNTVKLEGDTAEMLFNAMLKKQLNADSINNQLSEGALNCQKTSGDAPSYECSIQL